MLKSENKNHKEMCLISNKHMTEHSARRKINKHMTEHSARRKINPIPLGGWEEGKKFERKKV